MNRERMIWALGVAVLLFLFWTYAKNEGRKEEQYKNYIQQLEREVNEFKAMSDSAEARFTRVSLKARIDSAAAKVSQNAKEREIKAYRRDLSEVRKQIAPQIDSFATVKEFVNLCDSLTAKQDALIYSLQNDNTRAYESFAQQLELKDEQIEAQKAISDLLTKGMEKDMKQVRKERRGKKFWRSAATVTGVAAIVLIFSQ